MSPAYLILPGFRGHMTQDTPSPALQKAERISATGGVAPATLGLRRCGVAPWAHREGPAFWQDPQCSRLLRR